MRFIALALAASVAACGGGGDAQTAVAPCIAFATVRVQLFGDSTMVNLDAWTKDASGMPALQRAMDARFGSGVVSIENRAVPGTTSTQLVNGADGLNLPWPQSLHADVILVNHGLNDIRDGDLAAYQANLRRIGTSGVKTLYVTPNPSSVENISAYAATMRATAQSMGAPLADVYDYLAAKKDWPALLLDGVHPLPETEAAIVADVIAPALIPMVAALRCE